MGAPTNILAAILHSLHAFLSSVILYLLSLGPTPRHIGFVMDGNRRYARGHGKGAAEGHHDGFLSLRRVSHTLFVLHCLMVKSSPADIGNMPQAQYPGRVDLRVCDRQFLETTRRGRCSYAAGDDAIEGVVFAWVC